MMSKGLQLKSIDLLWEHWLKLISVALCVGGQEVFTTLSGGDLRDLFKNVLNRHSRRSLSEKTKSEVCALNIFKCSCVFVCV